MSTLRKSHDPRAPGGASLIDLEPIIPQMVLGEIFYKKVCKIVSTCIKFSIDILLPCLTNLSKAEDQVMQKYDGKLPSITGLFVFPRLDMLALESMQVVLLDKSQSINSDFLRLYLPFRGKVAEVHHEPLTSVIAGTTELRYITVEYELPSFGEPPTAYPRARVPRRAHLVLHAMKNKQLFAPISSLEKGDPILPFTPFASLLHVSEAKEGAESSPPIIRTTVPSIRTTHLDQYMRECKGAEKRLKQVNFRIINDPDVHRTWSQDVGSHGRRRQESFSPVTWNMDFLKLTECCLRALIFMEVEGIPEWTPEDIATHLQLCYAQFYEQSFIKRYRLTKEIKQMKQYRLIFSNNVPLVILFPYHDDIYYTLNLSECPYLMSSLLPEALDRLPREDTANQHTYDSVPEHKNIVYGIYNNISLDRTVYEISQSVQIGILHRIRMMAILGAIDHMRSSRERGIVFLERFRLQAAYLMYPSTLEGCRKQQLEELVKKNIIFREMRLPVADTVLLTTLLFHPRVLLYGDIIGLSISRVDALDIDLDVVLVIGLWIDPCDHDDNPCYVIQYVAFNEQEMCNWLSPPAESSLESVHI